MLMQLLNKNWLDVLAAQKILNEKIEEIDNFLKEVTSC